MSLLLIPIAAVLLAWSVNFSIRAHLRESDKEMWIDHLKALVFTIASMIVLYFAYKGA